MASLVAMTMVFAQMNEGDTCGMMMEVDGADMPCAYEFTGGEDEDHHHCDHKECGHEAMESGQQMEAHLQDSHNETNDEHVEHMGPNMDHQDGDQDHQDGDQDHQDGDQDHQDDDQDHQDGDQDHQDDDQDHQDDDQDHQDGDQDHQDGEDHGPAKSNCEALDRGLDSFINENGDAIAVWETNGDGTPACNMDRDQDHQDGDMDHQDGDMGPDPVKDAFMDTFTGDNWEEAFTTASETAKGLDQQEDDYDEAKWEECKEVGKNAMNEAVENGAEDPKDVFGAIAMAVGACNGDMGPPPSQN